MNFSCATLFLAAILLFLCGCQRQEEPDVAIDAVRSKFRYVQVCLNNGRSGGARLLGLANEIGSAISAVSNVARRAELASEFSKMLLAVDLKNQPYLSPRTNGVAFMQRESATIFFYEYIFPVLSIMRDNGCRPKERMDFFFAALSKYKDACFSVPLGWRELPDESRETCSHRNNTAYKLWGDYRQRMSEIRRFILPRLSDYLPVDLHDEFRCRIKPFFDFPSKKEISQKMHPGYKCTPPLPTKTSEKKLETTKPEDAVEVDI